MLAAGSDTWLQAQVATPNDDSVHKIKCIDIQFFSVKQAVFLYTKWIFRVIKFVFEKNSAFNEIMLHIVCLTWSLNLV